MAVGLQLAGKNDFVKVQENINNNLTKLDNQIDFNLLATLGIEYGGILNDSNAKISGKAYYDQTGKKLYKCTANTSLNYADASYFVELSNNDLLGKLQNLARHLVINCEILDATLVHSARLNVNNKMAFLDIRLKAAIAGAINYIDIIKLPSNIKILYGSEYMIDGLNIHVTSNTIKCRTDGYIPKFSWGAMVQIPICVELI